MRIRRAKIIATLGPVSSDLETIEKLIIAGVDVFRLNFSHSNHEIQKGRIQNVREASKNVGREVAILMDLQGPKIRVGKLAFDLQLLRDDEWYLGTEDALNSVISENKIPTVYEKLTEDVRIGDQVLFNDGLIESEVVGKEGLVVKIRIKTGGKLTSHKGINLPDTSVSASSMTEKDFEDLYFGVGHGVDYVALSFVKDDKDILRIKYILHEMKKDLPIISKIERPDAVRNIKKIIQVSDAIMVARGDMGVELGNHRVPAIQKMIIENCNEAGVPVITATQMLESMIQNSTPTRAEATDVANAIWDGTDAVMLSGETAVGAYPLKVVEIMGRIVEEAEKIPKDRFSLKYHDLSATSTAVQVAASLIAEKVKAKKIISFTRTGNSCKKLAKFRPKTSVFGVANSIEIVRRMNLYWGITPFIFQDGGDNTTYVEKKIIDSIKESETIVNGDKFVITYGDNRSFSFGSSNAIRVELMKNIEIGVETKDFIEEVEFDRGSIIFNPTQCASCQNCIQVCPHDIWKETPVAPRLTYINKERVNECTMDNKCVESCPTNAIEIKVKP